jgi:hypothetical protein
VRLLGSGWHARHTDRSRKARNARRQLEALGYDVTITLRQDAASQQQPHSRHRTPRAALVTGSSRHAGTAVTRAG